MIIRRCLFDLRKAEDREHILLGLSKALDHIDEVIAVIRASRETNDALLALMDKFSFTKRQAQAILDMRLQRLTGLEKEKIEKELEEIKEKIAWLKKVLADIGEVLKIISEELNEVKEKYGNERKTKIDHAAEEFDFEDLIENEEVLVSLTQEGYVKRMSVDQYKVQKRGGKGVKGSSQVEGDFVREIIHTDTYSTLLVFTDKGKVYWTRVHSLPKGSRTTKVKSIKNAVQLSPNESVAAVMAVSNFADKEGEILFATSQGIVKRTNLEQFSKPRASGLIALTTDLDDTLINAKLTSGKDDLLLITKLGMSIRFDEDQIRSMGRTARGVKGIKLSKGDEVVGSVVVPSEFPDKYQMLILTSKGFGKRTKLDEYRNQSRGGVGITTQKITDKVGEVVKATLVCDSDELVISTNKGQAIRLKASEISTYGRSTQGLRIINLNNGEYATGMTVLPQDSNEDSE